MNPADGPRVLLSAYQCGPGMGSVSQIGWEWYRRMADRAPTTLFTHVRNREAIEGARGGVVGSEVVYIDTEWFAGPLYRTARRIFPGQEHAVFLVSSLDFFPYDAMVVREAKRRMDAGQRWDVVHQVTPVSPSAPTRLGVLGAPVVIGPINGGLENPPAFSDLMKQEARWIYPIRHLARAVDALWGSTRRAAAILTATRSTRDALPKRHRHLCVPMNENGVDLDRFGPADPPPAPSDSDPLRVVFVGRLVPVKGVAMLLDALARVNRLRPVELVIVGDGPMRATWEARAVELGVGELVAFTGSLSLDEVAARMRDAHVLCLPSVRESGGAVLLEAMATARPVLVVSYGGPAEIVDDSVGRGIEARGPGFVTDGLAAALLDASENFEHWRKKGENGRRVAVERYSWDAKVETALDLYGRLRADDVTAPRSSVASPAKAAGPLRSGA